MLKNRWSDNQSYIGGFEKGVGGRGLATSRAQNTAKLIPRKMFLEEEKLGP